MRRILLTCDLLAALVAPASAAVAEAGGAVTLAEDGLGVTGTAEGGVFTVIHTQNKAGTPVLGYFA